MFIRKKVNASGSTSIQIVQKLNRKNKVVKVIGSSKIADEIEELYLTGLGEIKLLQQAAELPFYQNLEQQFVQDFTSSIQRLHLVGPELLLGKIFDDIGFNTITDDLFRHLVITRLVYPVSKLKTVDYLARYKGIQLSVYSIYRYLDKLQKQQIEQVKSISLKHTLQLFGNVMSIVFYDVTTLYFEAKEEDDFKRMGFSKDGKHQQPQIVLGLLVSQEGYPLDYDVFEGDKYEGDTLLPIIEHFVTKHKPEQLIKDEQSVILDREDGSKLIVSYKKARAINDFKNRKRGLEKLEKKIKSGKLTKQHINNKGYNKYLKIKGEATISINKEKIQRR